MGGVFHRETRDGARAPDGFRPSSGWRSLDPRPRVGRVVRYLLGSVVDFLVEDSCVVCRRPHGWRRRTLVEVPDPARAFLEPVIIGALLGALSVENRPLCPRCAGNLVNARLAGVLGRRVGPYGIETELGGAFGKAAGGANGVSTAENVLQGAPGEGEITIISPFMTTDDALEIIHLLKFGGHVGLARPVARAMAWSVGAFGVRQDGPPFLVPVPMDARSLRRRGFNPAERVARELSIELGFPVADVLRKVVRTRPQSQTPREDRAANVREAFDIRPEGAGRLSGRAVLLVDDLVTTGATAAACGTVLFRAGASTVSVTCFGRAL